MQFLNVNDMSSKSFIHSLNNPVDRIELCEISHYPTGLMGIYCSYLVFYSFNFSGTQYCLTTLITIYGAPRLDIQSLVLYPIGSQFPLLYQSSTRLWPKMFVCRSLSEWIYCCRWLARSLLCQNESLGTGLSQRRRRVMIYVIILTLWHVLYLLGLDHYFLLVLTYLS